MSRSTSPALLGLAAVALAVTACDVRPLTSRELYGGSAGTDGGGGAAGVALDGGAGTPDAATEAPVPDAGSEAPVFACAAPCAADQFCDDLTGHCAPRNGVGMLSGQIVDDCSGESLGARVGIAGKRMCSYEGKGSYFFNDIPLGKLSLGAAKDGYELYGATVDIVPGGVVKAIRMMREGGCAAPRPADVPCTCTTPTCQP